MNLSRALVSRAAGLGLCALIAGCQTDAGQVPTVPELAEAKGGGKGPPGGQTADPSLVEFFVYEDAGGQDVIHVVVDGEAAEIGYQTSVDHFQNGYVDGGDHYEFFQLHAPRAPAQTVGGSLLHVDVPFDGESAAGVPFFDHPYLDVDDAGGDPFVFRILAWRGDEAETGSEPFRLRPMGVMDAGLGLHDASVSARSYAVFQGPTAERRLWVESLGVDEIRCSVTTVRTGKGKNRTETAVTRVEVDGSVVFAASDGGSHRPWVELHLYDAASGSLSARLAGTTSGGFSHRLEVDGTPGQIYVVLDYVRPDAAWGVYDPASNQTPSSAPGLNLLAPVAVSAPATCPE